jgi:hypothetical protein
MARDLLCVRLLPGDVLKSGRILSMLEVRAELLHTKALLSSYQFLIFIQIYTKSGKPKATITTTMISAEPVFQIPQLVLVCVLLFLSQLTFKMTCSPNLGATLNQPVFL